MPNNFVPEHLKRELPAWGFFTRWEVEPSGERFQTVVTVRLNLDPALRKACRWVTRVEVDLPSPGPLGMGVPEDIPWVDTVGLSLNDTIEKHAGVFVGYRRRAGVVSYYVYMPTDSREPLEAVKTRSPVSAYLNVSVGEDPEWSEYHDQLYPWRPMDLVQIHNGHMVWALQQAGENLHAPHWIRHLFVCVGRIYA